MSILDALKVQKAEQKSVRQLAMLPQQLIIQMAQRGDIPADVAPVVINEKARLAQEEERMRALAAQSQGIPRTVMEQAMATNARAEAPQGIAQVAQPPQAPQAPQTGIPGIVNTPETQAAGITALPTGAMFNEQNFAGGGIVAFAGDGRSDVDLNDIITQQQRKDPSFAGMFKTEEAPSEAPGFRRKYTSLADALKEVQEATSGPRAETPEEQAWMQYQKGQKPRSEAEMAQQGWLRALEAGLGIMGGTSPYALTNIGKGAESAVKGYGEDVKDQRRREAAFLQSAAQQARQKRLEGIEDVKAAQHLLEKDIESEYRHAVLNKDTDYQRRYNSYLPKVMKDLGTNDPKDPEVMAETARRVDLSIGAAAAKLGQRASEEEGDRSKDALVATQNALKSDNQYRILSAQALGGKDAAEKAERQKKVDDYVLKTLNQRRAAVSLPPLSSLPAGAAPPIPGVSGSTPAAAPSSSQLPPSAVSQLKEGFVTTFANGQKWTLENGKPKQVR